MKIIEPIFSDTELEKVKECLDSGWVTQGPMVNEFEKLFSAKHNATYSLATTSCTAALQLATMTLGLGIGDEVIVPAFTWVTSAHCIEYTGAKAVFADVDINTFNISPREIRKKITANTKAIVVVHLFGLSAEMDEIMAIAEEHNLKVIEDAACAVGTTYKGQPIGTIGDFGCFSFHPRKVITTGEGGMVTTNSEEYAKRVNTFRNHGATGPNPHISADKPYSMGTFNSIGFNLRLSDIQAAVGVAQMSKLDIILEERKMIAERYNALLQDISELSIPFVPEKCGHTYQSYVIRILGDNTNQRRNLIMDTLAEENIQTRPGTHAVHRLGYYTEKYNLKTSDFPIAAICEDMTITLPIFHEMKEADQELIVSIVKNIMNH